MVLIVYSGARGTLIYEKNLKSKFSCQTPYNPPPRLLTNAFAFHSILQYFILLLCCVLLLYLVHTYLITPTSLSLVLPLTEDALWPPLPGCMTPWMRQRRSVTSPVLPTGRKFGRLTQKLPIKICIRQ